MSLHKFYAQEVFSTFLPDGTTIFCHTASPRFPECHQGSHRLFTTGFKVFSRIFKVNNNNSQGYILRHGLLYLLF